MFASSPDPGAYFAFGSLLVAALVAVLTFGPYRAELKACRRERLDLRRRLELVTSVIIRTLPQSERIELLAQLDERLDTDPDARDERRRLVDW